MHPTIYYLQAEWRAAELRQEAEHQRLARKAARGRRGARTTWTSWTTRLPRLSATRVAEPRTG